MLSLTRHGEHYLGERRMLAALSVIALLVCHGVLGGLHLACAPSSAAGPAAAHAATHHVHEPHGQETGSEHGGCLSDHGAGVAYYAVLLGLLLASALLLAFGTPRREEVREPGGIHGVGPPVTVWNLPRGPTLPRLQVFRL